jgi:hypothetical protein
MGVASQPFFLTKSIQKYRIDQSRDEEHEFYSTLKIFCYEVYNEMSMDHVLTWGLHEYKDLFSETV